jgi:hypothetical protein
MPGMIALYIMMSVWKRKGGKEGQTIKKRRGKNG